jgi:hypothetical protein
MEVTKYTFGCAGCPERFTCSVPTARAEEMDAVTDLAAAEGIPHGTTSTSNGGTWRSGNCEISNMAQPSLSETAEYDVGCEFDMETLSEIANEQSHVLMSSGTHLDPSRLP